MDTIIGFLKGIDADILSFIISVKAYFLSFIHNMDPGTKATIIMVILFGIPFVAMIVYAIVLANRGKRMGIHYETFNNNISTFDDHIDTSDCNQLHPFNYSMRGVDLNSQISESWVGGHEAETDDY